MAELSEPQPEIVFRDEHLLVLDKPPGLPTTAPRPGDPSLAHWARSRWPELRPHPTSRLDAPVSGLVTFALSRVANQRLLEARRAGAYERVYLGITLGRPSASAGEWTWPMSLHPGNPTLRIAGTGRGQREARTRYEVAASTPHATLLRMRPRTGRTHQLRVHAAEAGVPLFGDHAYQGSRRITLEDGRVVTARRVMLHCVRVSFPWSPTELRSFESPVRPDLRRVWTTLGGAPSALDA